MLSEIIDVASQLTLSPLVVRPTTIHTPPPPPAPSHHKHRHSPPIAPRAVFHSHTTPHRSPYHAMPLGRATARVMGRAGHGRDREWARENKCATASQPGHPRDQTTPSVSTPVRECNVPLMCSDVHKSQPSTSHSDPLQDSGSKREEARTKWGRSVIEEEPGPEYTGPRPKFPLGELDAFDIYHHVKTRPDMSLHPMYMAKMLFDAHKLFQHLPRVTEVTHADGKHEKFVVVGDLHGQLPVGFVPPPTRNNNALSKT